MLGSAAQIMRRHNRVVANRFGGFLHNAFSLFSLLLSLLLFPKVLSSQKATVTQHKS